MTNLLERTNEEVDKVIKLIEENLLPIPDDKLRDYWEEIQHHYIHFQIEYSDESKILDQTNSDNIIAGARKHFRIATDIINKRQG
jgi:transcriptional regulatory protein LevR